MSDGPALPPPGVPGPPPVGAEPEPTKKAWWKRWWAIAIGVLIVLIVLGAAFGGGSEDEDPDDAVSTTEAATAATEPEAESPVGSDPGTPAATDAPSVTEAPTTEAPPAGGDEADDVAPCVLIDAETIQLDVTNHSSKQSSYVIDVNFLDAAGARVGDESAYVNDLRPGEHAIESQFVFETAGGTSCEIAEVDRFASESPNDVSEVTCESAGEDFVGDLEVKVVATNGSSELSDYYAVLALTRDGIRVGTASAAVENVKPGESAPGDGFSTVDGPADGVTCETVSVTRSDSSG